MTTQNNEAQAASFDFGEGSLGDTAGFFDRTEDPAPVRETVLRPTEDGDFFSNEEVELSDEPVEATEGEAVEASQEDGEAETVSESSEQPAVAEVLIDAFKKEHKFKLDPEDADLRRTLRRGIKAPKIKAELNKLKSELDSYKSQEVQDKIQVWDQLKEFAADGDYDRVFSEVLGKEAFDAYMDQKFSERLEYEEADPSRRAEMDMARYKREQSWKEKQWERERNEIRSKEVAREEALTLDKWESYGVPALDKYGFSESEVADADRRHQLNQHLWESTWTAIEKYADGDQSKITPSLVQKAFMKKAALLKYGSTKPIEKKVEEMTEKRQQEAAATAANIATSNYPKQANAQDSLVNDWIKKGGRARDLLRSLKG